MKRSACLIFNPAAGQGNPDQDLARIRALLEPEIDLDIQLTSKEQGAGQLAKQAIARSASAIIASGGDGTLSSAATAVVNSGIPFGVISRGTANAFASALDIPNSIDAACATILEGHTRTVDTAFCNGRPMVLLAGIGFEAEAVARADRRAKNRFGVLAYILAGLQQLRQMKSFSVEIETPDKIVKTRAAAVTIANAAPPTSVLAQGTAAVLVDDGLLDLTVVAPSNIAGAIAAVYHLFQTATAGDPAARDDIGYLRSHQFKVTTRPAQRVVLDGEMIGTTPVEIRCLPQSLEIFVPGHDDAQSTEKLEGLPNLVIESKRDQF
ncbi:MAG: YegS/Rv2252/BmrU family lipid kinase [Oculatellaceae cyanobacterium Prado106]|jgi:YegS/Rv2252/BmrU family lipid kinase|nr:YegS/Rv2252/BmrU family lipid kinase [Oculatellaceae cyanobacterium Prado106]